MVPKVRHAAAASPGCRANCEARPMAKVAARVKAAARSTGQALAAIAWPMSDLIKSSEDCMTMAEVRAGVDALDRELVALLATRFGYMRAAARIKPERGMVRDEARKAQVIAQAKEAAFELGVPVGLVGDFWERLVEASIAYEGEHWELLRR